jgi:hypothetical protein
MFLSLFRGRGQRSPGCSWPRGWGSSAATLQKRVPPAFGQPRFDPAACVPPQSMPSPYSGHRPLALRKRGLSQTAYLRPSPAHGTRGRSHSFRFVSRYEWAAPSGHSGSAPGFATGGGPGQERNCSSLFFLGGRTSIPHRSCRSQEGSERGHGRQQGSASLKEWGGNLPVAVRHVLGKSMCRGCSSSRHLLPRTPYVRLSGSKAQPPFKRRGRGSGSIQPLWYHDDPLHPRMCSVTSFRGDLWRWLRAH